MLAPLTFESLTIVFFVALALAAPATRTTLRRRFYAVFLCAAVVIGVMLVARTTINLRGWLGHAYLAAGYWIPALLAPIHSYPGRFESWLVRIDRHSGRFAMRLPAWAVSLLELSYLLCYLLVPTAFVLVWMTGTAADVDRFWSAVLLSGFVCYGSLPWLVSRPPRSLGESRPTVAGVRRVNEIVLARVSHGLNTFPSGHVAVSIAAALEVVPTLPRAGIALLAVAAGVAAGAVTGRYHYGVDVVLGAAIAIGVSLLI